MGDVKVAKAATRVEKSKKDWAKIIGGAARTIKATTKTIN